MEQKNFFTQGKEQLIQNVLYHCANFSPYYKKQKWARMLRAGKHVSFPDDIPITPKKILRSRTEQFYSTHAFPMDGPVQEKFTSGTSGTPLKARLTTLMTEVNHAENLRLRQGWIGDKLKKRLQLRPPSEEKPSGHLEKSYSKGIEKWTCYSIRANQCLEALIDTQAEYINGYPSLIFEILRLAKARGAVLPLQAIATVGEVVGPELLDLARGEFEIQLHDTYGTIEAGIIAGTCKTCGNYHVADKHMVVEILDDAGKNVPPGMTGRVVVTPLFNSAMTLLRYDLEDMAAVGPETCPRGKVSLTRIIGRRRDVFKLRDGRTLTPLIPAAEVYALGISRFKLLQTDLDKVEFQYSNESEEALLDKNSVQRLIDRYLDPSLNVTLKKFSSIPRTKAGKFRTYESTV